MGFFQKVPEIVYVEDEPLSREIVHIFFERVIGQAFCHIFDSSRHFLERVEKLKRPPDLFLVGIRVRPLDGYGMLAALRADPRYNNARVVALTASVMAGEVERMRAAGFDGLIGKPIDYRLFPDQIDKILRDEPVWYVS